MKKLSECFGDPHQSFKIVHIAGTNGKGSVSIKTAVALEKSGFKTGLYTSPHLSCFRERIQINRNLISEEDVVRLSKEVIDVIEQNQLTVTFFEIITMIAFLKFKEEKIDYAVLECGLGGRLDATNIVYPEVCAITSVGWDHVEALGDTLQKIAIEKSGIIKEGVPIVVGIQTPHKTIQEIAEQRHSKFIVAIPEDEARLNKEDLMHLIKTDMKFMEENNAVVVKVLQQIEQINRMKFDQKLVADALNTNQPCRMQKVDLRFLQERLPMIKEETSVKNVYLDVSHNLSAFEAVIESINLKHPGCSITIVCGFSKMKDINSMLEYMLKFTNKIHFVVQTHFKLASLKQLMEYAQDVEKNLNGDKSEKFQPIINDGSISSTIEKVLIDSISNDVVLICGSFYIMEEVREYFGYDVPKDPKTVNTL